MSKKIARIGDTVSGTCNGDYSSYEIVRYDTGYDKDGNYYSTPVYDYVIRNESGTFTGTITSGSNTMFVNGKGVARIGDTVNIIKSYSHGSHYDSLNITGTITSGSNTVFTDGKGVAYEGCTVESTSCLGTITSSSSNGLLYYDKVNVQPSEPEKPSEPEEPILNKKYGIEYCYNDGTVKKLRPFNPDTALPWKDIGRVILDSTGKEIGNLHPDDSNKWEDGINVDWSTIETNGWNVMVRIPKFYFKKMGFDENDINFGNGHRWYISPAPTKDFELHPAFMRCRDKLCDDLNGVATEVSYRYAPAFLGWVDRQGRLRSLPNKKISEPVKMTQARDYAKANGNGWGLVDFNLLFAIQLLFSIEYGSYDSQTALGRGFVDGNSDKINTGGTLQYGNHSFGETTGKKQMSYRGMEDLWGNCHRWIDGFCHDNDTDILIGNKGFNNTGEGYSNKGWTGKSSCYGWIGNIQKNKDCGFVMSDSNGCDNVGLCDYGFLKSGYTLPVAGGHSNDASRAGIFYFNQTYYNSYGSFSSLAF